MSEERVSRSVSFAFLAQMVGAVLTAVLTVFLGRALTEDEFGSFTFAMSVVMIATLFADLGITSSSDRFLAEHRDDRRASAAIFRTSLRLKLRVSVLASVALVVFAGPICAVFGVPEATWPLRAMAFALLAQSMFLLLLGAFISLGRIRYNVGLALVESVIETATSIAFVVLGAGATGAAFGRAIGYTAGFLFGLSIAVRVIGGLRRRPGDDEVVPPRRILGYAGPLLLVDASFRVFGSIDVLLIAALVGGGGPVAAFGLAMRLAAFLDYPAAAVASAVAPRMARREREGARGEGELRLFTQSVRYLTILQMVFAAPLLIWPTAIMQLIFGDKYPEAPAVLRALAPFVYLAGLAQLTTLAVNYLGEARRRVPIAVAMLTVNVVIDVLLLPRIGVVAGAIGTSVAYAVWVPAHIEILRRRLGISMRPLLVTTLRTCVAGAAMVGALALIGTGVVPFPLMLVGAVVGPAVYVAVLFALRELTGDDVAFARRVLRRRVTA